MIDDAVHAWFQSHRMPALTLAMLAVTYVHNTVGLLAMTALLAGVLRRLGDIRWILALFAAVPGAMLLNVAVKNLVQRARPVVHEPLLVLDSYSFPSGHAAGTTALYAFLAAWLLHRWRDRPRRLRRATLGAAACMALWVSLSRVYLGVHYLSDVLAGMLLGFSWMLLCLAWLAPHRPART